MEFPCGAAGAPLRRLRKNPQCTALYCIRFPAQATLWHTAAGTLTGPQALHLRTRFARNGLQALQLRHTYSQNL
jgi:hypothetical protein